MVNRKYRQHPLSHIPGGCVVKYIKEDGHIEEYDWVTFPEKYINDSLAVNDLLTKHNIVNKRGMIAEAYVDGVLVWDTNDQEDSTIQQTDPIPIDIKKLRKQASKTLQNVKRFAKRAYKN